MNTAHAFADAVAARCDIPCPAVQGAIDALVFGERFRGRDGMLGVLRSSPHYDSPRFNASLLEAWKEADIELATGRSRDGWLDLAERMKVAR